MQYHLLAHHFTNTNHVTLELIIEQSSTSFESVGMIGVNARGVLQDESVQYQAFDVEHYTNSTYKQTNAYHTRDSIILTSSQATAISDYVERNIGRNTSGNSVDLLSDVLDAAGLSSVPLSSFFDLDKDSLSFAYASLIDFFTLNDTGTLRMWTTFNEDRILDFQVDPAAVTWFVNNFGPIPSNLEDIEAYEYAYNTLVNQGYKGLSSEDFDQFASPWGSLEAFVNDPACPLVIDLDQDGVETIARADSDVQFDIDGDGQVDQVAWLNSDDGFLALDQNGNGIIDDVSELFGGDERGQGFAKLATLDSNGDGVVSDLDDAFSELLIWVDANVNGQTDEGELASLAEYGINQLSLDYTSTETYQEGNLIGEVSSAEIVGVETQLSAVYFVHDSVA